MIDVVAALVKWFNAFAQEILKLSQAFYHDVYKEEKDFGAAVADDAAAEEEE